MILDQITNLSRYQFPMTKEILEFIKTNDCMKLPNEQINIQGEELLVKVMEYEPRNSSENKFESHRKYADLQYVVSGTELMQVVESKYLTTITEYDDKGDFHFYKADKNITDLVVEAGQFTIFYPTEAHRPACIFQNNKNKVKKLVFKIRMK